MSDRPAWRVAILGLGHWYSAFGLARGLREYPKAELVAAAWDNERQLESSPHVRREGLPRLRRAAGARAHRHRAPRGACRAARRPDDPVRAGRQAHHPRQADGDERRRGRSHDRRGRSGRRVVPGVPGHQPVAMRRHQGADRRGGHRRHRPAASRLPMVDRRGLVPLRHAGMVCGSASSAGRGVHRRGDLLDRPVPVARLQ